MPMAECFHFFHNVSLSALHFKIAATFCTAENLLYIAICNLKTDPYYNRLKPPGSILKPKEPNQTNIVVGVFSLSDRTIVLRTGPDLVV